MSDAPNSVERFLDRAARRISGSGLHPVEILRRVRQSYESSARDGISANVITIRLHPADFSSYADSLDDLAGEVLSLAKECQARGGWRRIGDWSVSIEPATIVDQGEPHVRTSFVDTSAPRPIVRDASATRRVEWLRDLALILSDGTRIALTHIPFSIGRGPENDLVIPSLAVSRRHAEIRSEGENLAIIDTGSRNGLLVNGERVAQALLSPGVPVTLGDASIELIQVVRRNG